MDNTIASTDLETPYAQADDDVISHDSLSMTIASSRAEGISATVSGCLGRAAQNNKIVLSISLVLFATITSAQVAGALIAGSTALLADCASMGLDTLSYAGNLLAECFPQEDARVQQRNYLITAGVSYAALIGISVYFLVSGIQTLMASGGDDEEVNPYIVFGFAVAGILFDIISLVPYCYRMRQTHDDASVENLKSACSHVSADLLRSISTFIESILLWTTDLEEDKVDATVTIIVTATIVIGVSHPVVTWGISLREYFSEKPAESHEMGSPSVPLVDNIKQVQGSEEAVVECVE
eukprot:TRINITY_DN3616_c0_g1_i1.p1 TRINITY_DN3616_c0_g1~~TRINITY_DN3616_c0_g1_i1.p1  ORF type:complete len:317 (+),score=108.70 TRINITY_DN3616_c0_g1_i1:64-951(+)